MAHSFKTNTARQTFGLFKESKTAGDYIYNKKAKTTFYSQKKCIPCKSFNTQSNLLLSKNNYFLNFKTINTSNLNINLITKLNLTHVNVYKAIDIGNPPYVYYNVDPNGELFGNTTCGINNFLNYLEYNLPYKTNNPGHINNL